MKFWLKKIKVTIKNHNQIKKIKTKIFQNLNKNLKDSLKIQILLCFFNSKLVSQNYKFLNLKMKTKQ